ncbi:uncharacterized protein LOC108146075 [Drosophila elegans]|uniref:uncharacterized protein LOC108146075 n=1 Tax=Drosophila elegans TaxID=30023 RepID=UPI0007E7CAC2|nr:uncharacterized protein LOC108146075 [Drosophila elegans]
MGGTKCCFRDCPISSSRNPSMHFFKFPAKDPKRLKDWVRYCGNKDVANASVVKLAGKTVCARHFRAESFMNYKMDRLIPMQTPTLLRINRDLALDFENLDQNGEALLVKLTPPTQLHLIPPKDFECPLGFVDGDGDTQNVEVIRKSTRTSTYVDQRIEQEMKEIIDEVIKEAPEKQTAIEKITNEEKEEPPVVFDFPGIEILEETEAEEEQEQESIATTSTSVLPQNILDIINQLQPSLGIKLIKRPEEIQNISEINMPFNETTKAQNEDLTKKHTKSKEEERKPKPTSTFRDVINKPKGSDQSQKKLVQIRYVEMTRKKDTIREMHDKELLKNEDQSSKEQAKKRKLSEDTQNMTENHTKTGNVLEVNPIIKSKQKVLEKSRNSNPCKPNPSQERQSSPSFLNLEDTMEVSSESEGEVASVEKPSSSEEVLHEKLLQDYNKLQAEYEKISEENAELKRLQTKVPKPLAPIKSATNSLTKPQLYIAIKKYLGPTMAALLRMEMFGGSEERTWKDDEREFAMELLQLGDEVYKYCCDEWRFRLPSLRIARSWLEQRQTEDVDEFLDL